MRRHKKALDLLEKLAVERSRGVDRFGRKRNPAQRLETPTVWIQDTKRSIYFFSNFITASIILNYSQPCLAQKIPCAPPNFAPSTPLPN